MSLRDLVDSDCGGSNSLVKFSTHFVQDHAFKDQGLKHPTQVENNEQRFLEASKEELVDEFFSSVETDTFNMDSLLAEMRGVDARSRDAPWPTQFTKKIEKQDRSFDPNIWSPSENQMLIKDELIDFNDNSEWLEEVEQSYQNQKNNGTKSRFDFDQNKQNIQFSTESGICDELLESYKQMSSDDSIGMPVNNFGMPVNNFGMPVNNFGMPVHNFGMPVHNFGMPVNNFGMPVNNFGIGLYGNPLPVNQDFQQNMFGGFGQGWPMENAMNTMSPSTSGLEDSILVDEKSTSSVENFQTIESENNIGNEQSNFQTWFSEFEEMKNAERKKDYSFTPENEMDLIEKPLIEGKRRLENGELPTAVLCFEAAVKQEPSNAEAWQLLGTTQAENEQDQLAITALNKCIELQPNNLTAVLCIAACYTNESCNLQACRMLMEWLNQNPKYTNIVKSKPIPEESPLMIYLFTSKLYETVKDMYIEAAQMSLETGDIDADVQNGLGVLLNLNNENDKAVDCFKAALTIRPDDARLWNRLGATLANGGRCEEAIEAYHNALQLFPGFVRARYNLGITCIHLDTYREAIEHLLEALNQQASAASTNFKSPALSDTIWSTLRLAISMAERPELLKAVNDRNLDLINEEFNGSDRNI